MRATGSHVAGSSGSASDGRTQTRLPWDSWKKPYTYDEPQVWFHEVLRADLTPYRTAETELIRRLAAAPKGVVPQP